MAMKLLMFHSKEFWYKTYSKTLENVEKAEKEESVPEGIVAFIQCEAEDEAREDAVVNEASGNIRWLAGKVGTKNVLLHSFAHLSNSKSSSQFAQESIKKLSDKLAEKGFSVSSTPFGYFYEFKIHVSGESLAKVFKSI